MVIDLKFKSKKNPTLQDVLECYTERDLFEHYLGCDIEWGKNIKSPIREDDNCPSFVIYPSKLGGEGKPRFMDHGTGITGDIWTFLQLKKGLSYDAAIRMVVDEFYGSGKSIPNAKLRCVEIKDDSEKISKVEFKIEKQNFTKTDIKYWQEYGISLPTLKKYNVISCKTVVMSKNNNNFIVRYYDKKSPVFAYKFGEGSYKIYCPLAIKQNKWLSNCTNQDIQGLGQLAEAGPLLIITKSLKDVMFLHELGYQAIALQSEKAKLPESKYIDFCDRFKTILCFYDNDVAGVEGAYFMYEKYGIMSIEVPFNTHCKDITDFYRLFGRNKAKDLMEELVSGFCDTTSK